MCLHENVDLTEEHGILVCWDCSTEFGRVLPDDTLMVPVDRQKVLLTFGEPDLTKPPEMALAVTVDNGHVRLQPVYPCRECGFDRTCEEGCHS